MIEDRLKKELNDEQYEAATYKEGPVVVMAGAGSGKTHTLVNRVAYLIDNWVAPARILLVTFTNSAADEMKSRSAKLLNDNTSNIVACTYHKLCNLMLRKYGKIIELSNYTILSPSDCVNLVDYVKSADIKYRELSNFPSSRTLVHIYSKAVNCKWTIEETLQSADNWHKYLDYVSEIEDLQKEIQTYKYNTQKLDYDDLLYYMNNMLDIPHIAEKIANTFDYIMVDEFQDTNNLQMDILLKIAKYNQNIMVVGDISQSIYAFRGANIKNLMKFKEYFKDCKEIVLHRNYRSTQEIIDFANQMMNTNQHDWEYHNMVSDNKHGLLPLFIRPTDDFEQTKNVVDLVNSLHKKGISYNDIAVIERGSMSSFGIETELVKNNIPFIKRGGMKFLDYDCVGDILCYLIIITKPYDLLSWFRILKVHPNIGDVTAKKIADNCKKSNFLLDKRYSKNKFYEELELLNKFYKQFVEHKDDLQLTLDMVIEFYFSVKTRAVETSRKREDYKIDALEKIENEKQIIEQLKNLSIKYKKITEFLDDLLLDSVTEESNDEQLTITTIHSAKGLEWNVVIMIDCVDGTFPAYITDPRLFGCEEDQEELRCFYVSVTRAKNQLYIFSPKMKLNKGLLERVYTTHYIKNSIDFMQRR